MQKRIKKNSHERNGSPINNSRSPAKRNFSLIYQYRSRQLVNREQLNQLARYSKEQKFKYYIGYGNNGQLIRRILSKRKNWIQFCDPKYMFINFRWQQTNKGYRYQSCIQNKVFRQMLNHFQFHQQLSNKQNLLKNLTEYCQHTKRNVFDIVPTTFVLNLNDISFDNNLNSFLKFFQNNIPPYLKIQNKKFWITIRRKISNHYPIEKKNLNFYSKPHLNNVFVKESQSAYIWILKPTFLNRGRGIHVFNELQTLQSLMNSYITGKFDNQNSKNTQQSLSKNSKKDGNKDSIQHVATIIKSNSFIIQKYLQKPMLIQGRKFDIRVWVLWNQQSKVYFFKQGYIRTSSQIYKTDKQSLDNPYIHLTNNAIQKNNKSYSKHEIGNQLSFKYLQQLLIKLGYNFQDMIKNMKQIIILTALSVRKKINKLDRSYCFQIYGYDFMLDQNSKLWLIQINTNPCIQQSSPLLQMLLPRMLDDAFKLTLDKIFTAFNSKSQEQSKFDIKDYQNNQNMWQLLIDLKK